MDSNSSTPSNNNSSLKKAIMTPTPAITELFSLFLDSGGQPKVTEFKKYLNDIINTDIKPLCSRSGKSSADNSWRDELKARFSGRGSKWVKLDNALIEPSLAILEEDEDIDCSEYRFFTQAVGYAWIRFNGPRINNGNQAAAFEIRTTGSTIDHTNQLFYINIEDLDNVIQPLGGTPHGLGLETVIEAEQTDDDPAHEAEEETQVELAEAESEIEAEEPEPELDEIALLAELTEMELEAEAEEDIFAEI